MPVYPPKPFVIDSLHVDALSYLLESNPIQLSESTNLALDHFIERIGGLANAVLAVQMLYEIEIE